MRSFTPQRVLADAVMSTNVDIPASWGATTSGVCCSCGTTTNVYPYRAVAARSFTAWAQQPHMMRTGTGNGWCAPCGLLVTASDLRRHQWHVTTAPTAEQFSPETLHASLSAPVSLSEALTAGPTGRQNLLLGMQWGHISTMWGVWPWHANEANMFRHVTLARHHHVTSRELTAEAPPLHLITQPSDIDWFALWEHLRPWQNTPQLSLALRVPPPATP
jgi:hypothetical protein